MTPISSAGCGTDMSAASEEGLPSGTSDNTASAELGVQDAALSDGMGSAGGMRFMRSSCS